MFKYFKYMYLVMVSLDKVSLDKYVHEGKSLDTLLSCAKNQISLGSNIEHLRECIRYSGDGGAEFAEFLYEGSFSRGDMLVEMAEKGGRPGDRNLMCWAAMEYVAAASIAQDCGFVNDKVTAAAFQAYRIFTDMEPDKRKTQEDERFVSRLLAYAVADTFNLDKDKLSWIRDETIREMDKLRHMARREVAQGAIY